MSSGRTARPPTTLAPLVCLAAFWLALPLASTPKETPVTQFQVHPGSSPLEGPLLERLALALADLGDGHDPRSRHVDAAGHPVYINRLIEETSPYLRQHAHNPVNWYPWGEEALARARDLDRPIFLSIGYATCHWCHVMEEESFDDEEVAEVLNRYFVPIKVDRELRPDLDEIYMTAVQLTTGQGGWPMSSFLDTSGRPFFGGTYYPKPNFLMLLQRIHETWVGNRSHVDETARQLAAAVDRVTGIRQQGGSVGVEMADRARDLLLARADKQVGGLSQGAPRFPHEAELLFLLERAWREDDQEALEVASHALRAMAEGGIRDHLGGGFHRYSVDARWLVPHFEKMLYNQALLGRAYTRAAFLTGDFFFELVAKQSFDYVLREMRDPSGLFFSATDADSEGEEGTFFVWTPTEIREALPAVEADLALELWGVTKGGNFEGKNVLHLPTSLPESARRHRLDLPGFVDRIQPIREKLRLRRERRPHPILDDKILTAWNALMITALAEAGELLDEDVYRQAARRAGEAAWETLRQESGSLRRARGDRLPAGLDEYAFLAESFLALYDAGGEQRWLDRARGLLDEAIERFWDDEHGGFFLSDAVDLFARPKSPNDGALPSGNGVAAIALSRLARRHGDVRYADRARASTAAFASAIASSPSAYSSLLRAASQLARGEGGPVAYGADGRLRARISAQGITGNAPRRVELELDLAEGWHVNAHPASREELVATELAVDGEGWTLLDVTYPDAEEVRLAFADEPLRVYQGRTVIAATVEPPEAKGSRVLPLRLRVQACDDHRCLRPESLSLELPLPGLPP